MYIADLANIVAANLQISSEYFEYVCNNNMRVSHKTRIKSDDSGSI